jgi:NAD(P)-dependent dehydrogenase (short-subunit alcohol dehydrogenase family)
MLKQFSGRVAVVTGAGSGIGRAAALAFANNGAAVVVGDINSENGEQVVEEIKTGGGEASFCRVDVTSATDVNHLVDRTVELYSDISFAFNNAGIIGKRVNTNECTEDDWDRIIAINLKGIWLSMKSQIPAMLRFGGGAIVNASSIAGLVGLPLECALSASKHGVVGLTKTAALEYAQSGIRINAICPGVIDTPLIARYEKENPDSRFIDSEPIGRHGQPEEIAEAVIWLCSDSSSFVTGHALAVDGGWSAQ